MTQAPAFNPFDPAFLNDPYPFYEMGRLRAPVLPHPGMGLTSVFGYDNVTAILRNHADWASGPSEAEMLSTGEDSPSMLVSNPPRHSRLRALVSQAFTPRMVDQLEPRIREVANDLLDDIADLDEADLVDALAHPLPVIMIAEILGIPPEDRDRFRVWSDEVVATLGSGIPGAPARELSAETGQALYDYFTARVEERRNDPRPDLISGLAAAEAEGSRLSFDELMQMLILLLVAGNETTTNLISNALLTLEAHPGEQAKLRANPSLLPGAIEEVLRFESPVQATVRRATRDLEVNGVPFAEGQRAIVWLAAANRDPAQFPSPEQFDIERTPNRHVAFGLGIHFCLGAPLARLEARVALETFLARYSSYGRSTQGPLPRVPTFIMHGPREMPLWLKR